MGPQAPEWRTLARISLAGVLLGALWLALALAPRPEPPALTAPAQPGVTAEPTEPPPTPLPLPETPEAVRCVAGLPSPRFQWTLYVTALDEDGELGMWVPRADNAGPYLRAYVMAKYGQVWYRATFLPDGSLVPDHNPPWPRPDLIRSAASGLQTARTGNPACGRGPERAVPPCVVELVYPLVFLDRLAEDGPYLNRTYFWVPSSQVSDDEGRPARLQAAPFSETDCDTRRIWPRVAGSTPAYGLFNGCGSASTRVDTCYAVGCGELTLGGCGGAP
jgi:hypothetical protein